jgi:hypothetical protein
MFKKGIGLKPLILLTGVVLVLYIGAEYLALEEAEKRQLKKPDAETTDLIWTMDYENNLSKTYNKHEDGSWSVMNSEDIEKTDPEYIQNLLNTFSTLEVVKHATLKPEQLEAFGLDEKGRAQLRFQSGTKPGVHYMLGKSSPKTIVVDSVEQKIKVTFLKEVSTELVFEVKGDLFELL